MSKLYSPSDVLNILRSDFTKRSLQLAESKGDIPTAMRVKSGKTERRKWAVKDIPMIGQSFGQFKKYSNETRVITFFTAKGGTLKTTTSFNFGRTLALHGLKVCLVGLDIQESLTIMALPEQEVDNLSEFEERKGLGDFFCDKMDFLGDCIYETDIPTLAIIPENYRLTELNSWLSSQTRREDVFRNRLLPELKEFDVVIFDCSPNWNELIKNALSCCDLLASPASIKAGTYQCFNRSISMANDFFSDIGRKPGIAVIPTLKKNTVLAKQISGALANEYASEITNSEIREVVAGEEANIEGLTVFESNPKSNLSKDYFDLFQELWARINKRELS
jgi:chromosome partitioning protein